MTIRNLPPSLPLGFKMGKSNFGFVVSVKRNRWLVGSILFVAVASLLAVSVGPFIGAALNPTAANSTPNTAASPATAEDQRAELEGRAKGYELVLEREPNNAVALQGLVETRIALGDLPGVVEPLERLAELNPDVPNYAVLLAQTKQQLGDLEGAAQVYRSILTTTPGNMEALQGLVTLLLSQQRPQAAVGLLQDTLKTAEQANEIQPGSIDTISVKLLLGQVYVEQEKFEDAIAVYDSAIQDAAAVQTGDAPDFRPTLAKALVFRQIGNEAEAQPLFEMALSMAPVQFKDRIQQLVNEGAPAADTTPETETAPGTSPETDVTESETAPTEAPAAE
ncbi:MAG: tetratricopeptide repeat protein [Cyanobacteria bacterium J06627_15]